MNFKKGFTLAEMVAVVAILMVLAAVSSPFVRGYIDDSYFYKAKIFLRQINEARLNFEKDYPGTKINGVFPLILEERDCVADEIYASGTVSPNMLVACHYITQSTDLNNRYQFDIGSTASCGNDTVMVSMLGLEDAGIYLGNCVGIDAEGVEHEGTTQH